MRSVVEKIECDLPVAPAKPRHGSIFAKRQFVRFQKPLLYPAQHAGVRENRDGLSVVLRGNFVQSLQKPTGIAVPRLTACYLPDALVVVKIVHIRLVEALEPAERHILPAADARFPEPPVRVERQPFGNIHRLCGPARPVEVACIAGVDRNIFKARPQRFDLPHAVFRNQRIVLSVHPPVGIAFRFGVTHEINCCHLHHRYIA